MTRTVTTAPPVHHRTSVVRGLTVAYREAGDPASPTVVLLHGFPTSSHMFRGLIEDLAGSWHVIAPDHVGFGASDTPPIDTFDYTFDQLAATTTDLLDQLGADRFALYIQDYGAPIGLRIASRHPHRVTALIVQNGNAYDEGLTPFWDDLRAFWADRDAHEAAVRELLRTDDFRWQYTHGVPADRLDRISPDTWRLDRAGVDRPATSRSSYSSSGTTAPTSTPTRSSRPTCATIAHPPSSSGDTRRDLQRRRRTRLPARRARGRAAPTRCRPLRPRNPSRGDRVADRRLPPPRPALTPRGSRTGGRGETRARTVQ